MGLTRSKLGRIGIANLIALVVFIAVVALLVRSMRTTARLGAEKSKAQTSATQSPRTLAPARPHSRPEFTPESSVPFEAKVTTTTLELDHNGTLERTLQLKTYLARHPERGIPEMRLLTDEDWIEQAKSVDTDTELGNRKALQMLRQVAQNKSGRIVADAMRAFMGANQGQIPTDSQQLIPFLQHHEDIDFLPSFELCVDAPADLSPNPATVWVFKQHPGVDPWFNTDYYVAQDGSQGMSGGGIGWAVEAAAVHYQKAKGTAPTDASQLIPFLDKPVPKELLEDIFVAWKKPAN